MQAFLDRPFRRAQRVGGGLARWLRHGVARRGLPATGSFWVSLELPSPVLELPLPHWSGDGGPALLELLESLEAAREEPRVEGILLELRNGPGGLAKAQALRRALAAARARGKPVLAWAESLDLESLYLASVADRLWMPETGRVSVLGLRADAFYLRDALARFDVRPEVVRIGSHKSAGEMFTADRMSDEQREQLEAILGDTYDGLVEGIAAGRGLEPEAVRALIDRGPYGAVGAREAGLIDACVYRDELEEHFGETASRLASRPARPARVPARALLAWRASAPPARSASPSTRFPDTPRLAYVVASGSIHRGRGPRGIASESLEALLAQLADDRGVRGVVLRIDSPGGDALASDLLWRALRALQREKPLVASLAEVAASGGYYLASAADRVLAEAATWTGSIGVIGGKLDLSGLYRRLGIGRDAVERGARAGMLSETRGFHDEERAAIEAEMRELYDTFVARVAEGRGLARAAVERAAQGRVWTAQRALGLGLVDALGGPLEALGEARRRAGLRPQEHVRIEIHPRLPRLAPLRLLRRWLA